MAPIMGAIGIMSEKERSYIKKGELCVDWHLWCRNQLDWAEWSRPDAKPSPPPPPPQAHHTPPASFSQIYYILSQMQGSICQFGIRMCVRSRRKKGNKRDWQGLEGPGNKWGCLIMGIPSTVWHFLPSCPWALSAAEKNRALCSGMVLNGGPEQFPREETERLIERVQCVARFFHYGHIFRRAVLTRRRLRLRVTSCLSLHTHTHREWGKDGEKDRGT